MIDSYFDKVYTLNQASRPDRWKQFQDESVRVGITKAEQVYSIPHETPFISFCDSQIALLQKFYDSNGVNLLALEDDVVFKPFGHLQDVFNTVGYNWDILYLGCNVNDPQPEKISPHVYRIRAAWTTHAIAYNRTTVKFILDHYKGWETDGMFDDWISRKVLPKFTAYVVKPFIAIQRDGFSDMWNGQTSYGWQEMENRLK